MVVLAEALRHAACPVTIDPTVDSSDASDSVLIGEYQGGEEILTAKTFIKITVPDMTGYTVTGATLKLYGACDGIGGTGDAYCDVVSAWTSGSSESTLDALSFGSSTDSVAVSQSGVTQDVDVFGAAGYGICKVYADDITGNTVTVMLKDDANTDVDDKEAHEIWLGTYDDTGSEWHSDTDANPPYIEITYASASGGGAPFRVVAAA